MQKQFSILATLLLLVNITQAAILRCSATATGPNIYASAQAAHDAATAGDTIHLEPRVLGDYGDLNITKKIILISTGDFLLYNPGSQANSFAGACGVVDINAGGEQTVISAKTSSINIRTSNVVLTNTRAGTLRIGNSSTSTITNIIITQSNIYAIENFNGTPWSDVIISNNILGTINMASNGQATIINNTYIGADNYTYLHNSTVSNNIFRVGNYSYLFQNSNCVFNNNIADNYILPSYNNINNVDMSTVFQNWGAFNGDNYQLNPSYPNQNLGAFAGTDPYKIACQPPVPAIYQLSIPSVNGGNTLPIQVSTKSNN